MTFRQAVFSLLGVALMALMLVLWFVGRPHRIAPHPPSTETKGPSALLPTTPLLAPPPAPTPAPTGGIPGQPQPKQVTDLLNQGLQLLEQNQFAAALAKTNAAIQIVPQDADAYELRGTIYVEEKLLDKAATDFQTAFQLDGKNMLLEFNLAEVEFLQKKYAAARPRYAALEHDPDLGDVASYRVFLCDLFGGSEDAATGELAAFNQVGSRASYYFANAAWSLYHHKTEDARGWLTSAENIYAPDKITLYATSLSNLGYLPLPPPSSSP